jgi:radical SAM superfamily enzyme YgiQ (UPF0313 family)
MKLQLVNPPLPATFGATSREGIYAPLNLLVLASVAASVRGCEVEILDGQILPLEVLLSRVGADVVGVSANIGTYDAGLLVAEQAHLRGATVIFGGPYPSVLAEEVLRTRSYIDGVVVGDGEKSIVPLVQNEPFSSIPNLVFRDGSRIRHNSGLSVFLAERPEINYKLVSPDSYWDAFRRSGFRPFHRPMPMQSTKGCAWRQMTGGCVFCAMPPVAFDAISPQAFWSTVSQLVSSYSADYIWDVSSDFGVQAGWLEAAADLRPPDVAPAFQVYKRVDRITEDTARNLRRIGCYDVFLGVEAGSPRPLARSGKGIVPADSLRAMRALKAEGMRVLMSLIFGLPGETEESAQATVELARRAAQDGLADEVYASLLAPVPGSAAFARLRSHPQTSGSYRSRDRYDMREMRRDWVALFCEVDHDFLGELVAQVRDMYLLAGSFG